jgi:hypothetical protein
MLVNVCIYIHVPIYIYLQIYIRGKTKMYIYIHFCDNEYNWYNSSCVSYDMIIYCTYNYVYTYMYIYVHKHVYMHIFNWYKSLSTPYNILMYIYIYGHTYMRTSVHAYNRCKSSSLSSISFFIFCCNFLKKSNSSAVLLTVSPIYIYKHI